MPFGAVWDYYCLKHDAPAGIEWMVEAKKYESDVLSRRV
jgi:L-rhamnose isomerase